MKKETQLLLKPFLAQAAHEGIKTVTRRTNGLDFVNEDPETWFFVKLDKDCEIADYDDPEKIVVLKGLCAVFSNGDIDYCMKCPYGNVGDLLWVREKWGMVDGKYYYYGNKHNYKFSIREGHGIKWKSSLHLPKMGCRILLEIISIRVERLRFIKHKEAHKEGLESKQISAGIKEYRNYLDKSYLMSPYDSFQSLWIKINGAESWSDNPWVWVIEFKNISATNLPKVVYDDTLSA